MNEIPHTHTAGQSASWTFRAPSAYPPAHYTLRNVIRNNETGSAIIKDGVPSGIATYEVSLTPAETAPLVAGSHTITVIILDDATGGNAEKVTLHRCQIQVLANPEAATDEDGRSFAERALTNLRAAYLKLSTGTLTSATVNGKAYTNRTLAELRGEIARFEELVAQEQGCGTESSANRNVFIRFTSPT